MARRLCDAGSLSGIDGRAALRGRRCAAPPLHSPCTHRHNLTEAEQKGEGVGARAVRRLSDYRVSLLCSPACLTASRAALGGSSDKGVTPLLQRFGNGFAHLFRYCAMCLLTCLWGVVGGHGVAAAAMGCMRTVTVFLPLPRARSRPRCRRSAGSRPLGSGDRCLRLAREQGVTVSAVVKLCVWCRSTEHRRALGSRRPEPIGY